MTSSRKTSRIATRCMRFNRPPSGEGRWKVVSGLRSGGVKGEEQDELASLVKTPVMRAGCSG